MMDILSKMNMEAHLGRPLTPKNKKLTLWKPSSEFLHCCIESRGCKFNRDCGACIMCDYGIGSNLTPVELEYALENNLKPSLHSISILLLGTYGSILDTEEVSAECFDVLLSFVAQQEIPTVIFETHCCTVNETNLAKIEKKLCAVGTNVIIEMGYESCDPYVLNNCLNKKMNLEQLCGSIALIHKHKMEASLNVFLGAPFLGEREQLDTSVESVIWAFEKGADSVVIFPCNIKPFTLLYRLYKHGLYKPVSQWMLVELLSRIPEENLNCVTLSWYGDRSNFYENDEFPLIPPEDCGKCHDKILEFYRKFMKEPVSERRKKLVEEFKDKETDCDCRDRFLKTLNIHKERPDIQKIKSILQTIS